MLYYVLWIAFINESASSRFSLSVQDVYNICAIQKYYSFEIPSSFYGVFQLKSQKHFV